MRKIVYLSALAALIMLSSCVTTVKTARSADTSASIRNATVADLEVTDHRVTYTTEPSKEIQRVGLANAKQAALQEALTANGNADVMVEPEFVISMKNNFLFGKEISSITVTGRPAYFKNFRTLNDTVWTQSGFYGQPNVVYVDKYANTGRCSGGILGSIFKSGMSHGEREASGLRSGFGFSFNVIGGIQDMINKHDGDNTSLSSGYVGGLFTAGFNVIPNLFIGAGTGVNYDFHNDLLYQPIFGNVRFNFSPYRGKTWFVDLKLGSGMVRNSDHFTGGLFANPSIGYNFGGFEIALSYISQSLEYENTYYYYGNNYQEKYDNTVKHIGLSIGFPL